MQYVSRNVLPKISILSFNNAEKAFYTEAAKTKTENIDILKDKKILEAFLHDIQDIINETNYNEKTILLTDLKNILLSLNAIKNKNASTNLDKIFNKIQETNASIQKILSKYGKTTDIKTILNKIISEKIDDKYIKEIFTTLNNKTLYNNVSSDITALIDKNNEKIVEATINQSNINNVITDTTKAINNSIKSYSTKTLKIFSKSFNALGSAISDLKSIASSVVGGLFSFTVNMVAGVIKTGYTVGKFIVTNTVKSIKTIGSVICKFLLSPPGIMFMSFLSGFLVTYFKTYINNKIDSILDIKDRILENGDSNIDILLQKSTDIITSSMEYIDNCFKSENFKIVNDSNDSIKNIYTEATELLNYLIENKDTIFNIIQTAATAGASIYSITSIALKYKWILKFKTIFDLLYKCFSKGGLVGKFAGSIGFTILEGMAALQAIVAAEKHLADRKRQMLNIQEETFDIITASNKLANCVLTNFNNIVNNSIEANKNNAITDVLIKDIQYSMDSDMINPDNVENNKLGSITYTEFAPDSSGTYVVQEKTTSLSKILSTGYLVETSKGKYELLTLHTKNVDYEKNKSNIQLVNALLNDHSSGKIKLSNESVKALHKIYNASYHINTYHVNKNNKAAPTLQPANVNENNTTNKNNTTHNSAVKGINLPQPQTTAGTTLTATPENIIEPNQPLHLTNNTTATVQHQNAVAKLANATVEGTNNLASIYHNIGLAAATNALATGVNLGNTKKNNTIPVVMQIPIDNSQSDIDNVKDFITTIMPVNEYFANDAN